MHLDTTIRPFNDFVIIIGQHLRQLVQEFRNWMMLSVRVMGIIRLGAIVVFVVIIIILGSIVFMAIDAWFSFDVRPWWFP